MKVVFFIYDCPIQVALVNKVCKNVSVAAVFKTKNIIKSKQQLKYLYYLKRFFRIPFELPFRLAWNKLKYKYKNLYPDIPDTISVYDVDNINDQTVVDFIKTEKPDLIVVSATTMIKKEIIYESQKNNSLILNLHTGVSPYIKGGPNCTNWCLAKNYYLIGNTVMKLDEGIDSGAIIATECTELDGNESLFLLHYKVMEHGFNLYTDVISCYVNKRVDFDPISQKNIAEGITFYTKDWTIFQVIKAYYHFVFYYKQGIKKFKPYNIKLFPFSCN